MKNLNKSTAVHISPRFSWMEWELYEFSASPMVAGVLNERLAELVNGGADDTETRREMHEIMELNRKYGCTDTEPMRFLESVLDEIFGD